MKPWPMRWCTGAGRGLGMLAAFVAVATSAGVVGAQTEETRPEPGLAITRSVPAPGATTHTMVPAERYALDGFKRWFLGTDYRLLWTVPLEVEVLDLDGVAGGLTPIRTGGFGQSISLRFEGADGQEYAVRSVDKDPTRHLLAELRGTIAESVIQDQISAFLPTAALVVDGLLEATGVLHAPHTLVVIPDDPRLGEFREQFAGLLGMLVLQPDDGPSGAAGFAGSRQISNTETFQEALEEEPCDRADAEAYLEARMMDLVMGDRDRHAGQWRWARYPEGDCNVWLPIPEDRDQAFVQQDGVMNWFIRRAQPQIGIKYEGVYPNIGGLTFNAWELDRLILAGLDQSDWDATAALIQSELTDAVIEDAVRRLPPEHYELIGERLTALLKQRRDGLGEATHEHYRLISRWTDVNATDEDEYAELEHLASGELVVRVGVVDESDGSRQPPYFDRTFDPDVTEEVRLYLHGGDDVAEVQGEGARIMVRIDGGGGDDQLVNSSSAGSGKTRFYDARGDNTFVLGVGAHVNERPFDRPPSQNQLHEFGFDWGSRGLGYPIVMANPDLGLYMGYSRGVEQFGFRKVPFSARHSFQVGVATSGWKALAAYDGQFRDVFPTLDGLVHFEYSGIHILNFHGFGNETGISEADSFYEVDQRQLTVRLDLEWQGGRNLAGQGAGAGTLRQSARIGLGPVLKYSDTPLEDNVGRLIATFDPPVLGTGAFGQVGAQAWVGVDTRDNSGSPKSGMYLIAEGSIYPSIWDAESTFGEVHGALSTYLTARIPTEPTLALRAGGKKIWGDFPFHEAAYLGGSSDLRGYRSERFAGEAAAFGNAELRFDLLGFSLLVPTRLGLFGAADVGRVFFDADPDEADRWHTAFGGGLSLSFIDRLQTVTLAFMSGADETGLYFRSGFPF